MFKWGLPLALFGGLGVTWAFGSLFTASTNRHVEDFQAPAQEVRIASSPGIELAGTYWPGKKAENGAIVLLHGNGSNRAGVAAYAESLVAAGYSVLAIDFRGHGESSPAPKSFGWFEAEDAHAAVAWLKAKNPDSKLGAIGLSLGGAASVLGVNGPLPVDALVLNAVYPDIRTAFITGSQPIHLGFLPMSWSHFLAFKPSPDLGYRQKRLRQSRHSARSRPH